MSDNKALLSEAEAWGIATSYFDWSGSLVPAPIETVEALVSAFRRSGQVAPAAVASDIQDSSRCLLPARRAWGWALQLYSLRSETSWGMGDLSDLARFGRWAADTSASFLMLNPLTAALPTSRQEPSPYYPSSRCFLNPLYLSIEGIEGASDLSDLSKQGRALNGTKLIERDRIFEIKMNALEALWQRFTGDRDFDRYRLERGDLLEDFCLFSTLTEVHGAPWSDWPAGLTRPSGNEISHARGRFSERISFHAWIQWLLDTQLRDAASVIDLVQDVAVGVDSRGADAWMWQDSFLPGFTVGAPGDEFNRSGQNWALPVFDPWALRSDGYEAFVATIRSTLRHAVGLRIDHVMGLFRLFVIPHGATPNEGTYIRYPHQDLLSILASESQRAGAFIVGEDLGTVQGSVRQELHRRRVMSYKVLILQGAETRTYPEQSFAAVTTHDLPTIAGLMSGADLDAQKRVGKKVSEEGTNRMRFAVNQCSYGMADQMIAVHERLANAASVLTSATLEDALGVQERPNMPGTMDEWPNWRIPLPVPLEKIVRSESVQAVARAMRGDGRAGGSVRPR